MKMDFEIHLVNKTDASFITDLRQKSKSNRFLSKTSPDEAEQIKWLREYKKREELGTEYYFKILEKGKRKGLFRLYKINNISFTIGSWLFMPCDYKNLPILTDLLMGDIGFYELEKSILLFDVRKDNKRVLLYHALKNPLLYFEDDLSFWYLIKREDWESSKNHVLNFFGISNNSYLRFTKLFRQRLI